MILHDIDLLYIFVKIDVFTRLHTQDHGDGVPALPGGRGAGSRILHPEDDRRYDEL